MEKRAAVIGGEEAREGILQNIGFGLRIIKCFSVVWCLELYACKDVLSTTEEWF